MSVIDDVKQKTDILDVIGQYVTLKKAGRNFKALCPFHTEKTPSFIVYADEGTWHCFGACNTGGDVFSFLMKKENIDFGEALQRLAKRAGVELVREGPGEDAERKRLRELLATASAHYHYLFKNHPAAQYAREYVARRQVRSETAEQYELGYAPNEWEAMKSFLVGKGYSVRDLEAAGLVIAGEHGSYYDRFRGRLMFPIRNRSGEVTGFGARTLTGDEPKYLNSPQTVLFDKSATLYGLDVAKEAIRSQNLAVIVEGYMDVIGAHQAGYKNVVASLGTALTEKQLSLLKRLTRRYALALDPDAAGEEATKRGLEVARQALDRRTVPVPIGAGLIGFEERLEAELLVIALPQGLDPDELIHQDPARWEDLVAHAEPLVDFYFRILTRDLDLRSARDKSTAVKRLAPIVQEIGDSIQRAHYVQQLARLVQVTEQTIAQQLTRPRRTASGAPRTAEASTAVGSPGTANLEEHCLVLGIAAPQYLGRLSFLEADDFLAADHRAVFQALRDVKDRSQALDREAMRARLDAAIVPLWDHLNELVDSLPQMNESDVIWAIETTAYRLKLQRFKSELARLEVMQRDQEEDRTTDEEHVLLERVDLLRRRIGEVQKALSGRTSFSRGFLTN